MVIFVVDEYAKSYAVNIKKQDLKQRPRISSLLITKKVNDDIKIIRS